MPVRRSLLALTSIRRVLTAAMLLCALIGRSPAQEVGRFESEAVEETTVEDSIGRFPMPAEPLMPRRIQQPKREHSSSPLAVDPTASFSSEITNFPQAWPGAKGNSPSKGPGGTWPPGYGWPGGPTDHLGVWPHVEHASCMDRLFQCAPWLHADYWFRHGDPDDPGRCIGRGDPLVGTSWLNRPHYVGMQFGYLLSDGPVDVFAEQADDYFTAIYVGHDFDHYWGSELRLAGGDYEIQASPTQSSNQLMFLDWHLLYYPWGDARWRPYYSIGLGASRLHFVDNLNRRYNEYRLHMPLSVGLKYQWRPCWALRFDVSHNITFGAGGMDTLSNVSLTGGLEFHAGGWRRSYFPWNPSLHLD